MNIQRALIVAAHPDDEVLGCGGIFSRFQNTIKFKVVFIAEGSSARFSNDSSKDCIDEIIHRTQCAKRALSYLGVEDVSIHNLPCCNLDKTGHLEVNKIIEKEISIFQPDTVFTHSDCDSNQDHHIVYNSSIIATRPGSGVNNLISYEVLSSTEWGFSDPFCPNLFFSLSDGNVDQKVEAMKFYDTEVKEFPYPRSSKGIRSLANFRGLQSGHESAEAFKIVRSFV
tara:strand:+ start:347 stop:1024 length:678 start_codon:yes stop_codon:yes gene_type:complete